MKYRTAWVALAIGAVCWGAIQAEGAPARTVAPRAKPAEVMDCSEILENLRAMKKAQAALMTTLVKKNDSMAETLDLYAQKLSKSQGAVTGAEISGLRKSAQSFRKHGVREQGIVQRFETISAQLLTRLETCLQSPKLAQRH